MAILEFTRAMDLSEDWELKKDAEKRNIYAPVLEFFNSLPDRQGWSLLQFNFTVGVRCSISSEDRTDPLYRVYVEGTGHLIAGQSGKDSQEGCEAHLRSTRFDVSQLLCSEI